MVHIKKFDEFINESRGQRISMRDKNRPFDPNNNQWTQARDNRKERANKVRIKKYMESVKRIIGEITSVKAKLQKLNEHEAAANNIIVSHFDAGFDFSYNMDNIYSIASCDLETDTDTIEIAQDFNAYLDSCKKAHYYIDFTQTEVELNTLPNDLSYTTIEGEYTEDGYDVNVLMFKNKYLVFSDAHQPIPLHWFEGDELPEHPLTISVPLPLEAYRGLDKMFQATKGFVVDGGLIFFRIEDIDKYCKVVEDYLNRY